MQNIIILGAAGRDFHNFNVVYRNDKTVNVVAFTANQIPGISDRKYPASLAGRFYPKGIPIYEEKDLERIIKSYNVGECVLSYSDLSYDYVMHLASRVAVTGAKLSILGAEQTMIKRKKPVIAVLAVRTGCGKSQTSRRIVEILRSRGKRVVSVRHPMPYGDLAKQAVQRFAKIEDLKKHKCTIEEMEEYEPHIAMGSVIYAGVDYGKILEQAEKEADVIIWDGGNNDTSFYKPDVTITVADPLRAGHEVSYYPGEINFRLADMILINKVDSADAKDVATVVSNAKKFNPKAIVLKAESKITVDDPSQIKGKKVLVVEDGPTLTHGEMKIGAGTVAAQRFGASKLVDPRPFISGSIRGTFNKYPNIGTLLPAMGYGREQMNELKDTINAVPCDLVLVGTPIDLASHLKFGKPSVRVLYSLKEKTSPGLKELLEKIINKDKKAVRS